MSIVLHEGDNRVVLRRLIDEGVRVHSVVTDPPYGLVSVSKRFGKEGAKPARTDRNDGSFARLSGGFMGKCFHPDTDIMTTGGWKRVGEVQIGEAVATLDPETRDLIWQKVEQVHAYPFDGEMVHINHRSAEQLVTPNHRVLVSYDSGGTLRLAEAANLQAKFHLFAQANRVSGRLDHVLITSERQYGKDRSETRTECAKFPAREFFRFLGLWLGDGYTTTRSDDHPANDFFGISVKKARKVRAVRSALSDLGIRFTETPSSSGGNTNFYCYNFALLGWLKRLGGAWGKYIPNELFEWDHSCLEELYQGLMETDGHRQGPKDQEIFYTTSKRLAEDFQRLCLHTGRSAAITWREPRSVNIGGNSTFAGDGWTCCVLQPGKRMYGENSRTSSNVVFQQSYVGEVFCIGVPEHHIIYTRYNGKPVWSGNSWDATGIERDPEFWRLVYDILLPGGYVFAFGGSRTGHWQAVAMELAGFIMHPMHGWAFGQGFPKGHAADKAIDRHLGKRGQIVPHGDPVKRMIPGADQHRTGSWIKDNGREYQPGQYLPATEEAAQWSGYAYGTQAQKPALEPIFLAQKPFSEKTGAANLLKHGVGAVNIDGCRVPADGRPLRVGDYKQTENNTYQGRMDGSLAGGSKAMGLTDVGRYPSNLILDGSPEVVAMFPDSKGQQGAVRGTERSRTGDENTNCYGEYGRVPFAARGDSGSAARFFHQFPPDPLIYHGKAGKQDRAGSRHPTVKPINLLRYLVRHITPPGGTVLDPFAGTGTTGVAALAEGMKAILIEMELTYAADIRRRFWPLDEQVADAYLRALFSAPERELV